MPASRPLVARFWEKVDRRGPDDCWPWTSKPGSDGYGRISEGGRKGTTLSSHRVAYELHHGELLDTQCVLHTCDNRPCCNPRHLFLGDRLANARDMVQKGRQASKERSGSAKLTEVQVEEIRRDYVCGSRVTGQCALGRKYNVDHSTIWAIVHGETWK